MMSKMMVSAIVAGLVMGVCHIVVRASPYACPIESVLFAEHRDVTTSPGRMLRS